MFNNFLTALLLNMADNLKCEENFDESKLADEAVLADIAQEKRDEEERARREIELYYDMRNYVNLLNQKPSLEQSRLKIISTAYVCEIDHSVFLVYSAKKWENFLVDGFAKYFEEKYKEKLGEWLIPCEFVVTETIPNYLYTYRFLIESKHKEYTYKMYCNNVA